MSTLWLARRRRRGVLKGLFAATSAAVAAVSIGDLRSAGAQAQGATASGAGVNVKKMPGVDGGPVVALRELFSFDPHYAQCVIEDNPSAFTMETFGMETAVIEAHQFYMGMYSHEMALASVRQAADGSRVARLVGQLGCATYAGTSTVTLGSRTALEPAFFEIEAVDAGPGGGPAGDRFVFTVFFDPGQAPLNHAIFGPNPSFTGEMVEGEVTIGPPTVRPLLS